MRLFYSVDIRSVALADSHCRNALAQEHIYRSDDMSKAPLSQNSPP
ncbi:hypothetical protein [Enterobacter chengduensis]|nr:hypothetical protein [Enterobacter chengduensis]